MPEGDVVWLAARHLHEALSGRALTLSDFRVPRLATVDLRGRSVRESVSVGKHLLTRVEGGHTIHTHLKMEGSWRIRPAGPAPRDHKVRLVLANTEQMAVGQSLGIVQLLPTAQEHKAVGHLGPDLLGPGWDPDEAVRRLSAHPDQPIGEALLDQTLLAGIGNIYKAETLFLRGVNPWTRVGDVPDLPALVRLAQRLLEANKERPGQITTGDRRPGRTRWVYGRARRQCLRCGTPIASSYQGDRERITYWCPRCQPRR